MWPLLAILLIAAAIAAFELPSLWRNELKKDAAFFAFLLLFGTGLSMAQAMQADIPNPLDWIAYVYKPLSDWIYGSMK
ncbi:hypothetical protein [Paenibacillus flagellatus]|uniref:Uncharacterized protein n=1 Tax=Paenibacillus flagellatus TaxID=2211139 RepID=A0A2V5KTB8_9BACL|nr:hypothetical protein [Paenibacillus flagellatus]PYI54947.1 hypothetical protein DLM86_10390 [Paenibacillus flagellatus]